MLELAEHTVVLAKLDLFDKAALEELAGETAADLRALLPSQLLSIAPALAIMYLKHCRDPTPAGFMFSLRSLADTFGKALTVDDVVALFAVSTLDVLKQGVDISKPAAITMARMNYVIEAQAKKVAELEAAHALALAKRPNNRGNEPPRRTRRHDLRPPPDAPAHGRPRQQPVRQHARHRPLHRPLHRPARAEPGQRGVRQPRHLPGLCLLPAQGLVPSRAVPWLRVRPALARGARGDDPGGNPTVARRVLQRLVQHSARARTTSAHGSTDTGRASSDAGGSTPRCSGSTMMIPLDSGR
jgi:hypothetical protein